MSSYWWTYPTANKEHQCDICGRCIKPGEKYGRCFGVDGRDADTWKECDHCQAVISLYGIEGDEGNRPTSDDMGEWECESVTELRHKAQWLKRWTRNDGTLYPIPMTTDERIGQQIRSRHPYAYRTGQWATIVGVAEVCVHENLKRGCYQLEWPDGAIDDWAIEDQVANYEFKDKK